MPHVDAFTLLLVDRALRGVGTLLFAVVLIGLLRDERWRNPLSQLDFTGKGPGLVHLVGVLVVFFGLALGVSWAAGIDPELSRVHGSHDWHLAGCVEDGAKLAASGLIVLILQRYRPFRNGVGPRSRLPGLLGAGGAAVLIILAITGLQLQTGQTVWRWLEPEAQQPIHPVLEAFERTSWGHWGVLQLTIAAVIVAPIAEELFFRGLLLQTLWRYLGHAWLAITLSGVAFGLIHHRQPQDVLPLITMGVILGYVRVRYRSLPACILAHSLFNARTVLFALLCPETARSGW